MNDITKAQFADFPNVAGRTTFSFAELQAALAAASNIGQGALIEVSGGFLVPIAAGADAIFNAAEYDDLGFFSLAAPTLFTIPNVTPAIQRIYLSVVVQWTPLGGSGDFNNAQVLKTPFLTVVGSPIVITGPPSVITGVSMSFSGGPLAVTAGDSFSLRLTHNSAAAQFCPRVNFSIWVAK